MKYLTWVASLLILSAAFLLSSEVSKVIFLLRMLLWSIEVM